MKHALRIVFDVIHLRRSTIAIGQEQLAGADHIPRSCFVAIEDRINALQDFLFSLPTTISEGCASFLRCDLRSTFLAAGTLASATTIAFGRIL